MIAAAAATRASVWRGLAVAPRPAFAAAIYLTSSRGGALAARKGVVVAVALARRWAALAAALVSAAGAAVTIAILVDRPAVVDGPLGSAATSTEE